PVLADREAALGIEGQPVRARLVVAADVDAGVAALRAKDGDALGRPAVDRVRVRRAEEQGAFTRPDRAFGELEAAGDPFEPRAGGQEVVEPRVGPLDLERRLPGSGC